MGRTVAAKTWEAIRLDRGRPVRNGARSWEYRRRRPEGTVLYEAVRDNLATFLAEASEVGCGLLRYVERDFTRYLECGVLAHGFARVRCESCNDELLVAFSCKGRGVCDPGAHAAAGWGRVAQAGVSRWTCSPAAGVEAGLRVLAYLTAPSGVRAILEHLGLPTLPGRLSPARGPPHRSGSACSQSLIERRCRLECLHRCMGSLATWRMAR
ncbi:transposase zinc-binding domain-containing protein [Corallococcus sp. CA053C]|uniref:transposase zinc-binding domain-containing protein n=1 Tax=Corallococcus sp. CA053C TaxID=2316732 RepID=UPI0034CF6A1F